MSKQLTLGFDAEVTLQRDGSYRIDPGKMVVKAAEDWRYLHEVMKADASAMPYRNRQDNVELLECGVIRGRQRKVGGWWEVEMNSVKEYFAGLETP